MRNHALADGDIQLMISHKRQNSPQAQKKSIFNQLFPNDLPKGLFIALIVGCLLLGLSALRRGHNVQVWLAVIEQWLFMLIITPTATTMLVLPHKYREPSFDLKKAYYLGMFVAFLFTLAKLRYWR